ncbi:helix-turn-helix domain-containing protein, partial [Actinokineospora diospyrosa]|uniref:helix-turn-helix domain-containing protein n=1 Tax=Actinokineospora diospyrosa TaxID=103728 RepID=UPI003558EAD6
MLGSHDRETISRELRSGRSFRSIALMLGRHHSVVAREVARNGGRDGYRAVAADRRAGEKLARPKPRKL